MSNHSHQQEKKLVASNRKAYRDFFLLERFEAGLVLQGTEVKSLRCGRTGMTDSYATVDNGEAFIHNLYIPPYDRGNRFNHNPKRTRKLLLHKRQIQRLHGLISEKGFTIVPLSVYFLRGRAKVELAVAKGKRMYDKRQAVAKAAAKREIEREMKIR